MIVMWLLIAVLPVQGIAAATMVSCGPEHKAAVAGMAGMKGVALASPDHDHTEAAPAHHHDDQASKSGDADEHVADASSDHADPAHKHGTSSCSACGACCIGAAILPATPDWVPHRPGSEPVLSLPASAILSHIAAGLERPPRFAFA